LTDNVCPLNFVVKQRSFSCFLFTTFALIYSGLFQVYSLFHYALTVSSNLHVGTD